MEENKENKIELIKDGNKNKVGRPKEWTEDRISDLAVRLEEWTKKGTSYALVQFCHQERLCVSKLSDLARENEEFLEALSRAKGALASRMIENINKKDGTCHPIFFSRYIRANDYFLDQSIKEIEKPETEETTKPVIRFIDFASLKKERDLKKEENNDCANSK